MAKNIKITSSTSGILIESNAKGYINGQETKVKQAYGKAVKETSDQTKAYTRAVAKKYLNIKSKGFPFTFTSNVYDSDKDRYSSVLFYNRLSFFKLLANGGTINKLGVVPFANFNAKRIGNKTWKLFLKDLQRSKRGFFKKVNGNLILFAKVDKTNTKILRDARSSYKQRYQTKRIKKDTAIPIGYVSTRRYISKKMDYDAIVKADASKRIISNFNRLIKL